MGMDGGTWRVRRYISGIALRRKRIKQSEHA